MPRKLYWADRLGVLVMADVPNSWGEPDAAMRRGVGDGLPRHGAPRLQPPVGLLVGAVQRAVGPAVEGPGRAGPEDGTCPRRASGSPRGWRWRSSSTRRASSRTTRPAAAGGHVKTDLNSLAHVPAGLEVEGAARRGRGEDVPRLDLELRRRPHSRARSPMLNSECGNVWGYEGSTGDVDWSFDYHAMMDEFRRHPKVGGLALHRAPRRDQRVERLRARRPLAEGDGPRRAGARA